MTKQVILLYGGGIDSTVLLAKTRTERPDISIATLFFSYGQKAARLEELACRRFCTAYDVPLTVVELPLSSLTQSAIMSGGTLANDPSVNIIDGRNLLFVSTAAMLAAKINASEIWLGFHVEPVARPFPDATPEFVAAANVVLSAALRHQVSVRAALSDMTRQQIFQWAADNAPTILEHAHTCYEDVEGGCGECSHCVLKAELLAGLS